MAWQDRSRRRLPQESAKRKAERPERRRVREVVLERDQGCQGRGVLPGRCWHPAGEPLDVHEVVGRGRGGSHLDPENCLALCRYHHRYVTEHPTQAEALGFTASLPPA